MGYYVNIIKSTATIPASNLDEAYRRMCALNKTHHSEKRGGRFGGDPVTDGSDKWFSWMPWNYPDVMKSAEEILNALGFECEQPDPESPLEIIGYDSKNGQEGLFIEAIADLFTEGSVMQWRGEDDSYWQWTLGPDGARTEYGRVVFGDQS